MVRIINYIQRTSEEGKPFFVLEVQGGIEMVKSQKTGQFYATARKASITSTFDEVTCKALVGTEMPGSIIKAECEPYEYAIRDTGEIIMLSHRFVYEPEEKQAPGGRREDMSTVTFDDIVQKSENTFSTNGHFQHH